MLGSSSSSSSWHRIGGSECRVFSSGIMIGGLIVFALLQFMSSHTLSHHYVQLHNIDNAPHTHVAAGSSSSNHQDDNNNIPATRGISSSQQQTPKTILACPQCPMCTCEECPACPIDASSSSSASSTSSTSSCPTCPTCSESAPTPSTPTTSTPPPPPSATPTPAAPCPTTDTSTSTPVVPAWPVKPQTPWYTQPDGEKRGVLVGYHYFEDEDGRENLKFFLEVGVMQYLGNPDIHFVFILASGCSIQNFPVPPAGKPNNIFITHRGNHGMDICGWNEIMREERIRGITGRPLSSYRFFIWMNASVRGPFLPSGLAGPGRHDSPIEGADWLDYFLIQINERDKLIGTTLNCRPAEILTPEKVISEGGGPRFGQIHLQSMFLAFDYVVLPVMLEHVPCGTRITAIWGGEVMLTISVLRAKYGIRTQLPFYNGINFANWTQVNEKCYEYMKVTGDDDDGDVALPGQYWGEDLHPLDVIFFKTPRFPDHKMIKLYTHWMLREAYLRHNYRATTGPLVNAHKVY